MRHPLVSIMMCTYNGAAFIDDALDDVLAQTCIDWELVVSDDGSGDDTVDRVRARADPRIRLVVQRRNLGYVANKNFAFALARGSWLTQLDQDDRSAPDRLERQVAALERTGLEICATGYRRLGLDGAPRGEVGPMRPWCPRRTGAIIRSGFLQSWPAVKCMARSANSRCISPARLATTFTGR
jgi:glycosyltransferase involved in cell wall biosynthesis